MKEVKKMTKLELIEELKSRPKDNITIKDCHLENNIVFDRLPLITIREIADALTHNAIALRNLSETLATNRIKIEPIISIGTEEKS